jgi:hypothetical protein
MRKITNSINEIFLYQTKRFNEYIYVTKNMVQIPPIKTNTFSNENEVIIDNICNFKP